MSVRRSFRPVAVLLVLIVALAFTAAPASSASKSIKGKKPVLVTGSCFSTYHGVTLKWKKVKGAKKYQIYRVYNFDAKHKTASIKIYDTPFTDEAFRFVPVSWKEYVK